ncbi:MAG: PKD domain-containing protein [Candidatus Thermoplasmatota archaeon]|nr:PKD domain-containing protein [Candidatus Thermoplasmatota archaeon]
MKKTTVWALALLAGSILLFTCGTSIAAEEITVVDQEDDVIDFLTNETTNEYPNIDITKLQFLQDGIDVTVKLTVKGNIQDLGSFDEEEYSFNDTVAYAIYLETSEDYYYIIYLNKRCVLQSSLLEEQNITDYVIDGSVLTVNFELNNINETYEMISADSTYMTFDFTNDFGYLIDSAADRPVEIQFSDIPNVGSTGETIQFNVFPDYGQPPYTFSWDFGDGTQSEEKNPTHTYTTGKTYTVTVTVTDQNGISSSDSGTIKIVSEENGGGLSNQMVLFVAVLLIIIVVGVLVIVWIIRR